MRIVILWLSVIASLLLASCSGKDDPELPGSEKTRRAVLVYAVAFNNLSSHLADDMEEMQKGFLQAGEDADSCRWIVFRTDYHTKSPELVELVRTADGNSEWKLLKTYGNRILSTDPGRMREVIDDVARITVNVRQRGLILWSHASGWNPAKGSADRRSFGQDNSQGSEMPGREMDIMDMARAIPSNLFDFIWADCCYMAGIEVAYELKERCDTYIAYPTEAEGDGMPYDRVMPYLLTSELDYIRAATVFFEYYKNRPSYANATVAVIRTGAVDAFAAACRRLMKDAAAPSASGLQQYSRQKDCGPYYDLLDLCRAYAGGTREDARYRAVEQTFREMVPYAAATESFRDLTIDPERFCGVSAYLWTDSGSETDEYYTNYRWFNAVYK